MGSRAGFRVPPPPAVDLRVGELFPGGRWKHRTNSPSTTSTLMVDQRQLFLPVAEDAIGRFVDPPRVV